MAAFARETAFIGRSEELRKFEEAGAGAGAGEGRVVLVGGEAGIGKSRLADEALRGLGAGGFLTLRGRCLPEAAAPYLPLFEALKSGGLGHLLSLERPPRLEYLYLGSPSGIEIASVGRASSTFDRDIFLSMLSAVESFVTDSLATLVEGQGRRLNAIGYGEWRIIIASRPAVNLVAVIQGLESESLVDALEGVLETVEGGFGGELKNWDGNRTAAAVLKKPLEQVFASGRFEGQEEAVDPKDRKFKVLEGLSRGLLRECGRRPIAVFLDDVHLADSATLSAFQYLARSNHRSRLLLIGTYRSEELLGRAGAKNPLSAARAALLQEGLLEEMVLGPLDEAGLRRLAEQELGVSHLDPELVSALYRETKGAPFFAIEVLRFLEGEGRLVRIGQTLHVKGALEGGAMPAHLRDAVLQRLLKLPREERDVLECAAVDGEVFSPARVACALDLKRLKLMRFLRNLEEDHHLVRLRGEAATFEHAKVREVIYEAIHADLKREYHAAVGECTLKEMEAAGRDLSEAVGFHFSKAQDARARPHLLKAAERAAAAYSNLEAAGWYEQYLKLSGEAYDERIFAAYGSALLYAGKFDAAASVFETLVRREGESPEYFTYLRSLAEAHGQGKGFEKAVAVLDRYRPAGEGLAWAKWVVPRSRYALRIGEVNRAEREVNQAIPILESQGGSRFDLAEANSVLAFIGESIGDYDMCIEWGKKAIEAGGEDVPLLAMYYNNVGVGYLFRGRFEESARYLTRGLEIAEARADLFHIALTSNNLGLLEIRRGDTGLARGHLLRGLKWAERSEAPFLKGMALDFLGLCAMEEGREEDAAEYFARAIPLTDTGGDKGQMIWLRIHLAELELRRGDPELVLLYAGDAYEIAAKSGDAPEQAMARALQARARGVQGDLDAAQKGFTDSARGLKFSPSQFEYAECLRLWGLFLLDAGRGEEAALRLAEALEVFAEVGAKGRAASVAAAIRQLHEPATHA